MPYTNITIKQQDPITAQGTSEWTFELTGGGLPPKTVTRVFSADVPNAELQTWAYQQAQVREGVEALFARLSTGQTFPITAPSAPPGPTAKEAWLAEGQAIARLESLGLTGAPATALATRKSTWITSYQAGFVA